ncbi:MAG: hypothetical protein U9O85_10580 [Euryarchaeota archaeon]|nr:hypothetical protein [Euryarchaeota archaeon]
MIQKNVKIEYGNTTEYIFCTVKDTDSWGDCLRQYPELEVYTPPEYYTNTAIVSVANNKSWIIVHNHDIPHGPIVIKGEVMYNNAISNYSGIIKVKEMPFYSCFPLELIKNREITRAFTVLIFIFWIALVCISLSEWRRGVKDENRKF